MEYFFQLSVEEAKKLLQALISEEFAKQSAANQSQSLNSVEKPISKTQIARDYNLSLPTITARMADGTLPFRRLGRRVYFLRSEVSEALGKPKNRRP